MRGRRKVGGAEEEKDGRQEDKTWEGKEGKDWEWRGKERGEEKGRDIERKGRGIS